MTSSYSTLGKYAIWQRNASTQLANRRRTRQSSEDDFVGRFARSNSPTLPAQDKQGEILVTETDKLVSLAERSHDNLFVAKTVFPFVLFTDSLKIDRQKLTIVHNSFFRTAQTASTEIKNIINVQTELGPLFGSMTITSKHFLNNTQSIQFLKRKDISAAQCLLQGFMIANRAHVDTSNIEKRQLLSLLSDLGQERT
jgi:hypothetical protein